MVAKIAITIGLFVFQGALLAAVPAIEGDTNTTLSIDVLTGLSILSLVF